MYDTLLSDLLNLLYAASVEFFSGTSSSIKRHNPQIEDDISRYERNLWIEHIQGNHALESFSKMAYRIFQRSFEPVTHTLLSDVIIFIMILSDKC